ncbi:hypothetical protein TcWFU_002715 [Taenia crassiceps]|uniref:Uncharacterized protein n=1 Tax=Taenia crassiceps TaxID=6207 RepID=A0ABR4QD27_9CEST
MANALTSLGQHLILQTHVCMNSIAAMPLHPSTDPSPRPPPLGFKCTTHYLQRQRQTIAYHCKNAIESTFPISASVRRRRHWIGRRRFESGLFLPSCASPTVVHRDVTRHLTELTRQASTKNSPQKKISIADTPETQQSRPASIHPCSRRNASHGDRMKLPPPPSTTPMPYLALSQRAMINALPDDEVE